MDNFLFFAILSGAACHVTWNILLKKSKDKVLFTRAFTLVASIFFIPVLFFVEPLPPAAYSFFIITLIIHTLYKFFLCRVYDNSELSYGYPLARGTPSLIVLFVTPLIFSDDLTISNIFSVSVLCFGIILLISIYNNFNNFSKIFLFLQILCFIFAFILFKSPNILLNTLYKDTIQHDFNISANFIL